jgi:hypothetical protein
VVKQNNPLRRIVDLFFSYSFVIAAFAIYHTLSSDSKEVKMSCCNLFLARQALVSASLFLDTQNN